MAEKERYVRIVVCPWCKKSFEYKRRLMGTVTCEDCGCRYSAHRFFMVPEKNLGMKDKNKDECLSR